MTDRLHLVKNHLPTNATQQDPQPSTSNMSSEKSQPQDAPLKHDAESAVKRNPHGDFSKVQASRPDWDDSRSWQFTKTRNPDWAYNSGSNRKSDRRHISIDPYGEGRQPVQNYKLLISGIVPRPIGFLSTRAKDGTSTNLSPFSYTQIFNHDPPIFAVGFSGGLDNAKDTLKNLIESGECVISIVSEDFIEAANATSIDLPYGMSEWAVSGLTPAECEVVKCSRVKESVFAVEGKLLSTQEFESRNPKTPGKKTGVIAIIEGVRFWVREDALSEDQSLIDPAVLKPVARLGGITYSRIVDGFEIPRPVLKDEKAKGMIEDGLLREKVDGQ
jgi:flavin reductase (DIM6/NTAB) family NADH-FMN oxidoreductase RutF